MNIHRYDYEDIGMFVERVRRDEIYGWLPVNTETGEVEMNDFQRFDDELRTLAQGWEWMRFTMKPSTPPP